ncbi:MAG: ABC transporter substrate-binding protein [Massiliimalia sp.]|jgi:spermidine/putrescine transport system substrate-binding protein
MKMKKIAAVLLASILSMSVISGCGSSSSNNGGDTAKDSGSVNIFTWDGYIPEDVQKGFTDSTGIKINYSNFESNEEMLTKLQAGTDGYDVVIASDYIIDIAVREGGIISELDLEKIPNFKNISPAFQNQYYDPENKYTVPYAAGTPLIVYDPSVVDIEITTYDDLWNEALADSVVMMDDGRNIIGMTLKSMGKSMNETDPAVLEEAKEKLLKLTPNIRSMAVNQIQDLLISGEASVGYMFASQAAIALETNPDLKVVYPTGGMGFGIDSAFVPEKSANKDNAYAFLNYILDGEVGAQISSQIYYLCPNQAADEYLPDSYKENAALFIPEDALQDTEFIKDVGDATSIYDKIWTEFKQQFGA